MTVKAQRHTHTTDDLAERLVSRFQWAGLGLLAVDVTMRLLGFDLPIWAAASVFFMLRFYWAGWLAGRERMPSPPDEDART